MHHDKKIDEATGDARKPEIISFYNTTKGGVDVVDQICSNYDVSRNSRRWPLTVFFSMMNIAAINAQVLLFSNTGSIMKRREFLKNLRLQLVESYIQRKAESSNKLPRDLQLKLKSKCNTNSNETVPKKAASQGRCMVCLGSKDRTTKYPCRSCSKFLCLEHIVPTCESCFSSEEDIK
jgi:hypothetical protein